MNAQGGAVLTTGGAVRLIISRCEYSARKHVRSCVRLNRVLVFLLLSHMFPGWVAYIKHYSFAKRGRPYEKSDNRINVSIRCGI